MAEARWSPAALWGVLLPLLTAIGLLTCIVILPERALDHGWGVAVGLGAVALLLAGFLLCGRAVRDIRRNGDDLRGLALARAGRLFPVLILLGLAGLYTFLLRR